MLKKLFSALGLNDSWNYRKNRSLLLTNVAFLVARSLRGCFSLYFTGWYSCALS